MSSSTKAEMGIMAGVLATVVMSTAVITITAISSAWNGFFTIQWFSWLGAVFGSSGTPAQLAELGLVWFVALGIVAGLIFAFAFKHYSVYQGLAFGAAAWFAVVLYLALGTAPQLSGALGTLSVWDAVDLLLPLAVCFALWGFVIGLVGKRYA